MQYLHRCPRKLGDELGLIGRGGFLRGRRDTFSRLALRGRRGTRRCLRKLGDELGLIGHRGFLRGRRDTFSTSGSICVAGVVLSVPP